MRMITQFIDGERRSFPSVRLTPVFEPNTGQVQAHLEHADATTVAQAVAVAKAAQPAWSRNSPQHRAQVMFRFKALLETHQQELAAIMSSEHGKLIDDSLGELRRGLDVVDLVCGVPHLQKGEYTKGAGPGVDVYSIREALGVVAGITPFNFPAMIPLWMMAPAIAVGNAFVLKPSSRTPSASMRLAELALEAGVPAGIFNVVHGDQVAGEAITGHPDIKAVSFVGSTVVAKAVYARGAGAGKRMQCMGGAKNHGVVLPDADLDQVVQDALAGAFGSAGQRCMAMPVLVVVGEKTAEDLRKRLVGAIANLRVGGAPDRAAQMGPVVTGEHKRKVEGYIQLAIDEGADVVVDGRGRSLPGSEEGFFLWPTLIDNTTTTMRSYQEEIFGPVLQIVRAETFEEALSYPSSHHQGNAVSIFTRSGDMAQRFVEQVAVGMVGVNFPMPVPVSYHSFGGWKDSAFGDLNQYGEDSIRFFTRTKLVTQRWPSENTIVR
ncbi:CoA-acylating methylmalonate-semialdehyde dehydrogenase [Rhizobium leguminosarum]|uniref:CoA-acylating methylmalonate-semialdehyde dehydrogenase n=1 Tax=Rhizobium leguminosarum TaxID=384 RepID=UPI0010302C25|nr:CoA-acylating methylmalonate-semialdehyde dehydrogenase [Rhizobium leguminosarum]TBC81295.1 CoA-acylating methylmalonate-semialdehyde dehydrogenase [Rhizobium leguminosarum]